jgi:hypothetical protein
MSQAVVNKQKSPQVRAQEAKAKLPIDCYVEFPPAVSAALRQNKVRWELILAIRDIDGRQKIRTTSVGLTKNAERTLSNTKKIKATELGKSVLPNTKSKESSRPPKQAKAVKSAKPAKVATSNQKAAKQGGPKAAKFGVNKGKSAKPSKQAKQAKSKPAKVVQKVASKGELNSKQRRAAKRKEFLEQRKRNSISNKKVLNQNDERARQAALGNFFV